jgi:serine phosphatase RsbU (regulator of sigma subunit)
LFGDGDYSSHTLTLSPGESLFFCTDGLTERSAGAGDEYGLDRLEERLIAGFAAEPRAMAASILDDVHRFSAHAGPGDDTTVLVIQRIG